MTEKPLAKRLISTLAVVALAGAGLALASSTAAGAHTPEVKADCSQLTVGLKNYSGGRDGATPNSIVVMIDGKEMTSTPFGSSYTKSFPFNDSTIAHEYEVIVDAVDNDYDRTFTGKTDPCTPPQLPKDASAALTAAPAECGIPEKLVLGETVNATWGTPTATVGPADYSVTATAKEGHLFADGKETKTFTGTLKKALETGSESCALVPPTTPPTTTPPTTPPTTTPPAMTPPTTTTQSSNPPIVPAAGPETPAYDNKALAETGVEAAPLAIAAVVLAFGGGLLVAVRRLRARTRS